jgi:prefoldin subunit 5
MLKTLSCALLTGLLLGLTSCGGGAASADEGKTVAEIQTSVQEADKSTLETAVESYKTAIASNESALETLQEKIKELSGGVLDGLLGGKGDDVKADLTKLQEQATDITATLKALKEKMAVYAQALAGMASG